MKYSRSQLKGEVKDDIRQSRPNAILVTLIFLIVVVLISAGLSFAQDRATSDRASALAETFAQIGQHITAERIDLRALTDTLLDAAGPTLRLTGISALFILASSALLWTLNYGYQGYCLNMIRRKKAGFGRLFCAFPQWGWVLLTQALIVLFISLWTFISGLFATAATVAIWMFLRDRSTLSVLLIAAAWFIAAVFSGIYIPLRYSMSNYVLMDERTDALEAISRSKAMLRGRKRHLFALRLSFIGWFLIVGLLAGLVSGLIAGFSAPGALAEAAAAPFVFLPKTISISVTAALVSRLITIPLNMWLKAYYTGAEAKFYDWLKQADIANGVWENDRQYKAPYNPRRHTVTPIPPVEPEPDPAPDVPDEEPQPPVPDPDDFLVSLSDLPVEEPPEPTKAAPEPLPVPGGEDFRVPLSDLPTAGPEEYDPEAPEEPQECSDLEEPEEEAAAGDEYEPYDDE